jgi:hypothetical protein
MSARSDVNTGPIGLKFGTNIGITVPWNKFTSDSPKRGPFPKIWGVRGHSVLLIAQHMRRLSAIYLYLQYSPSEVNLRLQCSLNLLQMS